MRGEPVCCDCHTAMTHAVAAPDTLGIQVPTAAICNGSATSEDLFWKLDALQTFIRDLHWPEEEFGKHLEQRLKLMASDMIESCVK
ncbi:unnamed protein product, partial [Ranitomeya imitator]